MRTPKVPHAIVALVLLVAGLELSADLAGLLGPRSTAVVLNLIGGVLIAGLTGGLAFSKWPQFVRPTAFCFLSKVFQTAMAMVGNVVSSAFLGFASLSTVPEIANSASVAMAVGGGIVVLLVFGLATKGRS